MIKVKMIPENILSIDVVNILAIYNCFFFRPNDRDLNLINLNPLRP